MSAAHGTGGAASMPLYEIRGLVCSYGEVPVLRIESLSIPADGPTAIVGHNGSGKSTLLKVLAFLLKPDSGTVRFQGRDISGQGSDLRTGATLLLQDPYLLRRSVFENVAYGLRARGENTGLADRVVESLELVGLSPDFAKREWFQLSGGESRRVALASRLVLRTKALLLDEPTANVDEENAAVVATAVRQAWERWGTVPLIASHDLPWVEGVTSRKIGLRRGMVEGVSF